MLCCSLSILAFHARSLRALSGALTQSEEQIRSACGEIWLGDAGCFPHTCHSPLGHPGHVRTAVSESQQISKQQSHDALCCVGHHAHTHVVVVRVRLTHTLHILFTANHINLSFSSLHYVGIYLYICVYIFVSISCMRVFSLEVTE